MCFRVTLEARQRFQDEGASFVLAVARGSDGDCKFEQSSAGRPLLTILPRVEDKRRPAVGTAREATEARPVTVTDSSDSEWQ